jgi:hypothetical protein
MSFTMGRKITYERWINLYLPDGWNEREEMGYVLLEKEGWPGMLQLSFIEREETRMPPHEAARVLLEDILDDRDIPFPREAIKVENRGKTSTAIIDYTHREAEEPAHWRIWFLVDQTRALMAAYISDPEHDVPNLEEAASIIYDIEFISSRDEAVDDFISNTDD